VVVFDCRDESLGPIIPGCEWNEHNLQYFMWILMFAIWFNTFVLPYVCTCASMNSNTPFFNRTTYYRFPIIPKTLQEHSKIINTKVSCNC
jgi:hypothetical protein